jgi:hypothetical protein
MLFRRRRSKTRWERIRERARTTGTNRRHAATQALGVAGGAAGLLAASAATSSMRSERR